MATVEQQEEPELQRERLRESPPPVPSQQQPFQLLTDAIRKPLMAFDEVLARGNEQVTRSLAGANAWRRATIAKLQPHAPQR